MLPHFTKLLACIILSLKPVSLFENFTLFSDLNTSFGKYDTIILNSVNGANALIVL